MQDLGVWPQRCQKCPTIITHTSSHPRVLRPGRAESGAFRSTPAPHMIGAEASSVVRIFSTRTCDTHALIMEMNSQAREISHTHTLMHLWKFLRHSCFDCLTSRSVISSGRPHWNSSDVLLAEHSGAGHGALGWGSLQGWEAARLRWKND